jgi:murein DD-endopeptidase MepM/ murein hydrolase activator NlpD
LKSFMKFLKNPAVISILILALAVVTGIYWAVSSDAAARQAAAPDNTAPKDSIKKVSGSGSIASPAAPAVMTDSMQLLFDKMMKLEAGVISRARNYEELTVVVDNMRKESINFVYIPGIIPLRPSTYRRISSHFGMRFHPIRKVNKMHYGMDISADIGTPVYATADGVVSIASHRQAGYGTMVQLTHPFGFKTIYGHLKSFTCVPAQNIRRGTLIGYVGSTGLSTGPHLHYEIVKNGRRIDPIEFVKFAKKIFLNDYD